MGLELVEFVITLEEEFDVSISGEVAQQLTTPRRVYEWLIEELRADNPNAIPFKKAWTRDEVIERTRQVIREQLGINEFSDDARFVDDLGIDEF